MSAKRRAPSVDVNDPRPGLDELVARVERATADAREATREAHSATKAARQAERDANAAVNRARREIPGIIDEQFGELVKEGLDRYQESVQKAVSHSYDRVCRAFDRYANLCMYGNEQGTGENIFDKLRARAQHFADTSEERLL